MIEQTGPVAAGIDTHKRFHVMAVTDALGAKVDELAFPASAEGYAMAAERLGDPARVLVVGVEGTGSYGAGVSRALREAGYPVAEVCRPRRAPLRPGRHKSDPEDALRAAADALRALREGRAAEPKSGDGFAEECRMLLVAHDAEEKAATGLMNAMCAIAVSAPEPVRARLAGLRGAAPGGLPPGAAGRGGRAGGVGRAGLAGPRLGGGQGQEPGGRRPHPGDHGREGAGADRHVRRGARVGGGAGRGRRRQPGKAQRGGRLRGALRREPRQGLHRGIGPPQAQPRRRQEGQQGPALHSRRADALRRADPGLRGQEGGGGQDQARGHALPEALHSQGDLPGPDGSGECRPEAEAVSPRVGKLAKIRTCHL